jgi:hypothetical protein
MQSLILGPLYSSGFILLLFGIFKSLGIFGLTNFSEGLLKLTLVDIIEMSGAKNPGKTAFPAPDFLWGEARSIWRS